MKKGMVTSNEPGLYFENQYGIRHENEILCIELENNKLGFEPTLELVEYDPEDYNMKKLSNYLLKINNHENKSTTRNRRFRVLGEIKI